MATYYPSPSDDDDSRDPSSSPYHQQQQHHHPLLLPPGMLYAASVSSPGPYTDFHGIIPQNPIAKDLMTRDTAAANFNHLGYSAGGMMQMVDDGQVSPALQPPVASQGLSLSLNTHILTPPFTHWSFKSPDSIRQAADVYAAGEAAAKQCHSNTTQAIRSSRYLRAVQDLLDEVASVWRAVKLSQKGQSTVPVKDAAAADRGSKGDAVSSSNHPPDSATVPELPASEKQELQHKLTKLLAMLDEVDRKYKHYYHQMQFVTSSFDAVAGEGSAKPYTAVALQTISCHFRCLKDAIAEQVQVIRRKLGEEEGSSGKEGRLVRLRYIDQQLRQQRTFQQYGIMHQNAWRPQRGLPENSVTILRAWLFEHFLHPYPKESEKLMLVRQTGLTRSQISNWFINARVRLWKPMIEDMYKEEISDAEFDSSSSENGSRSKDRVIEEKDDMKSSAPRAANPNESNTTNREVNTATAEPQISFQNNGNAVDTFMGLMLKGQQQSEAADSGLLHEAITSRINHTAQYIVYPLASELGQYGPQGSVSLTLGLQHPSGQPAFPVARDQDLYGGAGIAPPDYDPIDQMEQRQRFEASPLLHDFVA